LGDEAEALLEIAGIDATLRAEEVTVKDWCLLSKVFKSSIFYPKSTTNLGLGGPLEKISKSLREKAENFS